MRHAVRVTIGALLAALCVLLLPGAASAQDATPTPSAPAGTGETVQGRLANEGEPVEGFTITVSTADGEEVDEAETDETGAFSIPVPGPGDYTVSLDEDSLPEGVAIREGRSSEVTLPVAEGQQRSVLFPLGEGSRNVQTRLDRLPGLAVEGLQFGLIIALAAVGLSLIYGTTGLTNFAHGELITLGALLAYWVYGDGNVPFVLAAVLAVVAAGVLGGLQDRLLWRPLRKRGTGLIAMLVVTIGLALFLRYFFLYLFGGSSQPFRAYESQSPIDLGPVDITPRALISMAIAIVVLLVVAYALLRTRIGKATRAVSDNPALVGSLVVGIFTQVSTLFIPSELKNAGALAILIIILLVRPQGILGRAERVG